MQLIRLVILLWAAQVISFAATTHSRVELDTSEVRKFYLEGDFERAIEDIERALKWDKSFSHQDSVFMYKHLGVMYAAKYETREKGKHFMYQLLTVEPAARILDMYASDMIYMIFKNTQAEFEANQGRLVADIESSRRDTLTKVSQHPNRKGSSRAWMAWTVGAVGAAGGVFLITHLMDESESNPRVHKPE